MKYVTPIDTTHLNVFELLNFAERESHKLHEQLESIEINVDSRNFEMQSTKDSIQVIAERLNHFLQHDKVDMGQMDVNSLLYEVSKLIEELMAGGTKNLVLPISDINDMAKNVRKFSKFKNSLDPKIYLPDIFDSFFGFLESFRVIKLFEEPLESIFKNFDFKAQSFEPDKEPFLFLREKSSIKRAIQFEDDSEDLTEL